MKYNQVAFIFPTQCFFLQTFILALHKDWKMDSLAQSLKKTTDENIIFLFVLIQRLVKLGKFNIEMLWFYSGRYVLCRAAPNLIPELTH